jgi:hypothetical protein
VRSSDAWKFVYLATFSGYGLVTFSLDVQSLGLPDVRQACMSSLVDFVDVAVEDQMLYAISRKTGEEFCNALRIADKDYTVSFSTAINREHVVSYSSGIRFFWLLVSCGYLSSI